MVMWVTLGAFTYVERGIYLERARTQLGATVSTLADFNELARQTGAESASRGNDARNAAIWRALLQYPTASIWVETQGTVTGGQAPPGDLSSYLLIEDARTDFTVHGALPQSDVLKDWYRSMWQRIALLLGVSVGFLLLTHFLRRALSERARAEAALREHDALLHVVTQSAAELLSTQHEDAVNIVLDMIGKTIGVSRVHLVRFRTDDAGVFRANIQNEWCAPGWRPVLDSPRLRDMDGDRKSVV